MRRNYETNLLCPKCGHELYISSANKTGKFICSCCGKKSRPEEIDMDDMMSIYIPMDTEEIVDECGWKIHDMVTEYQSAHGLSEGYCGHNLILPDGYNPYEIGFSKEDEDGEKAFVPKWEDLIKMLDAIDEMLDAAEKEHLNGLWVTDGLWANDAKSTDDENESVKAEDGMHYFVLTQWCGQDAYFKTKNPNPDFFDVVDWFTEDADDPYDESDYKGIEELQPEEIYERLKQESKEMEDPWTDMVVEINV